MSRIGLLANDDVTATKKKAGTMNPHNLTVSLSDEEPDRLWTEWKCELTFVGASQDGAWLQAFVGDVMFLETWFDHSF